MSNSIAASIEKWFVDQEDEFEVHESEFQSHRYGNIATAKVLVYTTKYHAIARVVPKLFDCDVAIIGRPGLPKQDDLESINASTIKRVFYGDADPPDLLTFAWLRSYLTIEFGGVNDQFLADYFKGSLSQIHIAMTEAELDSRNFLADIMPDHTALIGPICSQVLTNGYKIELEGATMSIDIES